MSSQWDVVIAGGGAAGLMCGAVAARRGRRVLVIDSGDKPGRKILISGGGRCNFTNTGAGPENYLSGNPRFCVSALSRYTAKDFIALVDKHQIPWHEKKLGQLFCDRSAKDIMKMLLDELENAGATLSLGCALESAEKLPEGGFLIQTAKGSLTCQSLVVATGGLAIPEISSPASYKLAEAFGLKLLKPRAGLVPFTLPPETLVDWSSRAGLSFDAEVKAKRGPAFTEAVLATHRGLSGPAILQVSSYWQEGEEITINLLPGIDLKQELEIRRQKDPRGTLPDMLVKILPRRLIELLLERGLPTRQFAQLSKAEQTTAFNLLQAMTVKPGGTEGWRTAEVAIGGLDTNELSSKTFETKKVPGLYFIGESVDVTGWLGGYNFQWAWSSAWCCGQYC